MPKKIAKKSIFIAVPNEGEIRSELAAYLLSSITKSHKFVNNTFFFFPQERPIDNNRNHIVETFMKSEFDYLLMIDSDILPITNVIEMIKNDVDICSADIYGWRVFQRIRLALKKKGENYVNADLTENALNEVDLCGSGCMLIHRRVFEKMKKPYFQFKYDENGRLKTGEDYDFCRKAKKEGFKVFYDTRHKTKHYTTISI